MVRLAHVAVLCRRAVPVAALGLVVSFTIAGLVTMAAGTSGSRAAQYASITSTCQAQLVADGNLANCDLTGANLSNKNLTGANLRNAILTNANLSGTNLTSAILNGVKSGGVTVTTGTKLPDHWHTKVGYLLGPGANLTSANLSNRTISVQDLTGAKLVNANLSNTIFDTCLLDNGDFSNANLNGANFTNSSVTGANFNGADLRASTSDSGMMRSNFRNAQLGGAVLWEATLTGVKSGGITGTPLALPTNWSLRGGFLIGEGANLTSADLTGVDLTNSWLVSATMTGVKLTNTQLSGAVLGGVKSGGVTGTPASLPSLWTINNGYLVGPGANLTGALLDGLNLANRQFGGTIFTSASLVNANLRNSYLNYAIFTNANLSGADFSGTTRTNLTISNTTCPKGNVASSVSTCFNYLLQPYAIFSDLESSNSQDAIVVYDGNTGTSWRTKSTVSQPTSAFFTLMFDRSTQVKQIRWLFGVSGQADSFKIQANTSCLAGVTDGWTNLATKSNGTVGVMQSLNLGTPQVLCQIRFKFTNPNGDSRLGGIAEVEIRGPDAAVAASTSITVARSGIPSAAVLPEDGTTRAGQLRG